MPLHPHKNYNDEISRFVKAIKFLKLTTNCSLEEKLKSLGKFQCRKKIKHISVPVSEDWWKYTENSD